MTAASPTPPPPYATLVPVPDRIEGARVVLRPLEVEDARAVFEAIEASRPRLVDWVPWAKEKHRTLEETIDYCVKCKAQWVLREALYVGIFAKDDGRFLGGAGFHPAGRVAKIDWSFPALEIGYWIRTGEEGKGFVGESVELMCRLAFETLGSPRVAAHCDPTNARSVGVIEKAGFVFEGILRNENRWWDGGLGDTCVYSMILDDWRRLEGARTGPQGGRTGAPTVPAGHRDAVAKSSRAGLPSGAVAPRARRIVPPGPIPATIAVPERIEGKRVIVRAWTPDDAQAVFEAANESRARLFPWLPWANDHRTVEESRDFCIRCKARWMLRTNLFLGIFSRESGRYLGGTGLHPAGTKEIDWSIPKLEIGYWVRTSEEGKGYVAEAVRLVTRVAFEDLHANRVQIQCDVRNVRSVRVMEAAGYVREAIFRRDERMPDGHVRDTAMYALTSDDWARRPAARP